MRVLPWLFGRYLWTRVVGHLNTFPTSYRTQHLSEYWRRYDNFKWLGLFWPRASLHGSKVKFLIFVLWYFAWLISFLAWKILIFYHGNFCMAKNQPTTHFFLSCLCHHACVTFLTHVLSLWFDDVTIIGFLYKVVSWSLICFTVRLTFVLVHRLRDHIWDLITWVRLNLSQYFIFLLWSSLIILEFKSF